MGKIVKFFDKHFWVATCTIYLLIALFSYGYINNLYFRNEDFGNIYHFLFGGIHRAFPYHGIKYLVYPLYLFFGTNPSGYFSTAFILYSFLPVLFAFLIWKFTKNKYLGFMCGILFAPGYIGSESKTMIELAIPEVIYLYSLFGILILYKNYLDTSSYKSKIVSLCLYLFSAIFISQRAFSIIFIIIITDVLLRWNNSVHSLYEIVVGRIKRLSPFILSFIGVYTILPFLIHGRITSYFNSQLVTYPIFTKDSYLIFLSDLGNFLIPSFFQQKIIEFLSIQTIYLNGVLVIFGLSALLLALPLIRLGVRLKNKKKFYLFFTIYMTNLLLLLIFSKQRLYLFLNSSIGLFLLYLILAVLIFTKISKYRKKILLLFTLVWLLFGLFFHFYEPVWIHPSTSRYFTSPHAFFSLVMAVLICSITDFNSSRIKYIVRYGLVTLILTIYLSVSYYSPDKIFYLERSYQLDKVINSLKKAVPQLPSGKSLLYFDVVNHLPTQNLFDSFFITGTFTDETALATFYKEPRDKIKIVKNYEDFIEEKNSGRYVATWSFFYDINQNLLNLTPQYQSIPKYKFITINDFSTISANLFEPLIENNALEVGRKIRYQTKILKDNGGSKAKNDILEIGIKDLNFPSYRPLRLEVTIKASSLISTIGNYPFRDQLVTEMRTDNYLDDLNKAQELKHILDYLDEKENFKKQATIESSGDLYPYFIQYISDDNLNTSWRPWFGGKPALVKISFPEEFTFSEIRWITTLANPPKKYKYQISSNANGPWQTIFSVTDSEASTGKYVNDKIPQTKAKYFQMEISGFYVDNPFFDNPTIAELELLESQNHLDMQYADFFINHPLAYVSNKKEAAEIEKAIQNRLSLSVYPISDKYLFKNDSQAVKNKIILDGKSHTYSFMLPPGGTKLKSLLLEFPSIPIFAELEKVSLTQVENP